MKRRGNPHKFGNQRYLKAIIMRGYLMGGRERVS
jgi:hypothetical protein